MRFSNIVLVRRPRADVFAFLTDPSNTPKWNDAITSAILVTPGPFGVGTRIRQTRSRPRPGVEELEVTEFVPDLRLAMRGDLGPVAGTLIYLLESVPDGTRLTNTADLSGRGPLRMLAPLATGRVREAVAANLETLRRLLESSSQQP